MGDVITPIILRDGSKEPNLVAQLADCMYFFLGDTKAVGFFLGGGGGVANSWRGL